MTIDTPPKDAAQTSGRTWNRRSPVITHGSTPPVPADFPIRHTRWVNEVKFHSLPGGGQLPAPQGSQPQAQKARSALLEVGKVQGTHLTTGRELKL